MIESLEEDTVINSHAYKAIRILYDKKGGVWSLALMETSDGVVAMLGEIPHFDPTSTQPERKHLKEIAEALGCLSLDGGLWTEIWDDTKCEVVIQIKSRPAHHHKYKIPATTMEPP